MNNLKIWVIIIIMGSALLGSMYIQFRWIDLSLQENKTNFENKVFKALNQVAELLIKEDKELIYLTTPNLRKSNDSQGSVLGEYLRRSDPTEDYDYLSRQRESDWNRRILDNVPIEERFDKELLHKYLKQQLENLGIKTKYNYGVVRIDEDNETGEIKETFFLIDNHYVAPELDGQKSNADFISESLYNSKFEVGMFLSEISTNVPGKLKIYFPNQNKIVWKDVIPFLIASVLFTLLILFCFSYVIWVIFRQKKISEIKTDFINNMTHEFKTPIATISLATDSILSPTIISDHSKVKRFTDVIKQENKRMLSQVEKVLQMAQLDKKNFDLKLSEVDLHTVILDAVDHINLQVRKRDGNAEAILQAKNPIVTGDFTHISNIIHNLLDNANKYTTDNPEIKVITKDVKNGVQVSIEDNGIGLSREAKKHIFEKFYRVHTGNIHNIKGFGLGLSYVKAMMTAHNGQVDVKSELGKGSSFILFFPYHQAA